MTTDLMSQVEADLIPHPTDVTEDGLGRILGVSKQRRSIFCFIRGSTQAPLKVLILTGQHGDERPARRTVEQLLTIAPEELAVRLPNVQLAIVPEANPDGCAVRARGNADDIDLNRDHQLLFSRETAAVHQFVRQWQPHVTLDLHSYPSRRLHLLARNLVLDHDVFLDVPSHPAILARSSNPNAGEVLRSLLRTIARHDIRADRYTIVAASGRARHSTSDVVDARNGLALRYGTFTILLENRQPRHDDSAEERQRLRSAQERALWTVLEWLARHHDWFPPPTLSASPEPGSPVPVHFKYASNGHKLRMLCRDVRHGESVSVTFSRYFASLEARRTVLLPTAYAVPIEFEALTSVLQRHGFASSSQRTSRWSTIERLRIERVRASRQPDRAVRKIVLVPYRMRMELDRYEIFPTRQLGGDALAVYLEPESKHGLHRFEIMQVPLVAPSWYPVLRVFDALTPTEP